MSWVYVLKNTNSRLDGLYKIGHTTKADPEDRAREISQGSGVIGEWVVEGRYQVYNSEPVERLVHQLLIDSRCQNNREMFEATLTEIDAAIREAIDDLEDHLGPQTVAVVTEEERERREKEQERFQEEWLDSVARNLFKEREAQYRKDIERREEESEERYRRNIERLKEEQRERVRNTFRKLEEEHKRRLRESFGWGAGCLLGALGSAALALGSTGSFDDFLVLALVFSLPVPALFLDGIKEKRWFQAKARYYEERNIRQRVDTEIDEAARNANPSQETPASFFEERKAEQAAALPRIDKIMAEVARESAQVPPEEERNPKSAQESLEAQQSRWARPKF